MKKKSIITIILIAIMFSVFAGEYIHYGYSVKCAKCVEAVKAGDSTVQVQVAWRTNTPYKKKGDKVYAKYHCSGGHYYWAEIR
jgi:uncharacterized protein YxeA